MSKKVIKKERIVEDIRFQANLLGGHHATDNFLIVATIRAVKGNGSTVQKTGYRTRREIFDRKNHGLARNGFLALRHPDTHKLIQTPWNKIKRVVVLAVQPS